MKAQEKLLSDIFAEFLQSVQINENDRIEFDWGSLSRNNKFKKLIKEHNEKYGTVCK